MIEFAGGELPRDLPPSWVDPRPKNDGHWWFWDAYLERWSPCACSRPPDWGDEDVLHAHGPRPRFVPEVRDGRVVDLGPVVFGRHRSTARPAIVHPAKVLEGFDADAQGGLV